MTRSTFSGPVNSTAGFQIAGVAIGSTAAELNSRTDDSAMEETIAAAGALSTSVAVSHLAIVAGGAVTLDAPTKPGFIKIIDVTSFGSNFTLALTNVVEGTAATTATFTSTAGRLVLVSNSVTSGKWIVLKQSAAGLTLT
jgi:hypothetical protein